MDRAIHGEGTPEPEWAAWAVLSALEALDLSPCRRAVVVAAHPDDETLGLGGAIPHLLASGASVVVVATSDGEASHPKSTAVTPDLLRSWRQAEAAAALACLADDLPGHASTIRLGLPDGALADSQALLEDHIGELLGPNDWCFATWDGDGHPDHEAVGRAAGAASERTGARLVAYPIWAWHWAVPGDPRLPWDRARRVVLSRWARDRKEQALRCFLSQVEPVGPAPGDAPVLGPGDLAHFTRPDEVVFL